MAETFTTFAENKAAEAENLHAFQGTKLLYIRERIQNILSLIGRDGLFDQYTRHDIGHIDEMLKILEWLIPDKSKECMTQAEWLMLVLSVYFHDMGMLVTKDEYNHRDSNKDFLDFKNKALNPAIEQSFKDRLTAAGEDVDRFLYQEFVRKNHALRIKRWITGEYTSLNNTTEAPIVVEINDMLTHLNPQFRRDLAMVCESHHLDDLDDFTKYGTDVHYGNSLDEEVNLHYIAIILRTADLLHITNDRTPTIQYHLIEPSDPRSILAWQKQMAVSAVLPKTPRNEEGAVDRSLPSDTIEITAYFDKPDQAEAFFGLSSYIRYMKSELQRNFEWIQLSIKKEGTDNYQFPWRKVDDSKIETQGFEPRKLEFTVDQASILQMLVGHTLYNDSSVVIRELVQNGIDAVKLQHCITNEVKTVPDHVHGEVRIAWKTDTHRLIVSDNGTGMTIEEVENFLLKVGASKYRSEAFQKNYPDFSAISRFGIGVLTCFLIADDIDITTRSETEETANVISLRQVNGKYLLKKVSPSEIDPFISGHGTSITLHVRDDFNDQNILADARKWILFPPCDVFFYKGEEQTRIGYDSPKDALTQYLTANRLDVDDVNIKIVEETSGGVILAYALRYNHYFHEWDFLSLEHYFFSRRNVFSPIGTCIDGIRVEFNSPGYAGLGVVSIANTKSRNLVLTNVARSAVEDNDQKEVYLTTVYSLYAEHIQRQLDQLISGGYSLNWAASECGYLIQPLLRAQISSLSDNIAPQSPKVLYQQLDRIKCIVVESNGTREVMSAEDVRNMETVSVVRSEMISAAESMLRQVKSETTLSNLIQIVQPTIQLSDKIPLLVGYNSANILHRHALINKEAVFISVVRDERRVDLVFESDNHCWETIHLSGYDSVFASYKENQTVHIPIRENEINGLTDEFGVQTTDGIYLSYKNPLTRYLYELLGTFKYKDSEEDAHLVQVLFFIACNDTILSITDEDTTSEQINQLLENIMERQQYRLSSSTLNQLWRRVDKNALFKMIYTTNHTLYRPKDWSRRGD